jgi:hypothetical protein
MRKMALCQGFQATFTSKALKVGASNMAFKLFTPHIQQDLRFPELILRIAALDTTLELTSEFMATSFLKYKWKESLLWFLRRCTSQLIDDLVEDEICDPHQKPSGVPNTHSFLECVDGTSAIPFTSNPHSIFVFCSLENFVAGVHDCINANWVLSGHPAVSDWPICADGSFIDIFTS